MAKLHVVPENIDSTACIMPGAYVAPGVILESGVVVGPNAVLLGIDGDKAPVSVSRNACIGANATILPGVVVGAGARVAPGSAVTRSIPPLAVVEGNPARIKAYVDAHAQQQTRDRTSGKSPDVLTTKVPGVTYHVLTLAADLRGSLSAAEVGRDVPFTVKRCFMVFDVPTSETRGEHAHLRCKQFLMAVHGSLKVVADDGRVRQEFLLDQPNQGLYIPPMVWGIQYCYTPDAILLVLASEHYEADDYIRHYDQFVRQRWPD